MSIDMVNFQVKEIYPATKIENLSDNLFVK